MTIGDLLKSSLRLIGVIASGETPSADEMSDALTALNAMLGGWSAKRLVIYSTTLESFILTPSTALYTMGSGGTFNTTRPKKILSAYVVSNGLDLPINVYMERDRYSAITNKTLSGTPTELFYDPKYTLGYVYLYPTPDKALTLYIESTKALLSLSGLTNSIILPDEYIRALKYNLAIEIAPEYGAAIPIEVGLIAAESLADVKRINAPEVTMKLESTLRNRRSIMNINTGE